MTDRTMSSSTAFVIVSAIVVVVGFLLSVPAGMQVLQSSGLALGYLLFFGNAVVWTGLFVTGLLRYGKPALWLLLVAPFAFYQAAVFIVVVCVFGL